MADCRSASRSPGNRHASRRSAFNSWHRSRNQRTRGTAGCSRSVPSTGVHCEGSGTPSAAGHAGAFPAGWSHGHGFGVDGIEVCIEFAQCRIDHGPYRAQWRVLRHPRFRADRAEQGILLNIRASRRVACPSSCLIRYIQLQSVNFNSLLYAPDSEGV